MTPQPCLCDCCTGISQRTPLVIQNNPGLDAIDYRIGAHPDFVASMHTRLSSDDYGALRGLLTHDPQDFSIALLDAFAACADVLTFYQERIASESFLRTAGERRSLVELARLINYHLRPGVAAETHLAFSLEEAPGAPRQIKLDGGVRVQSEPGPNEKPQTFETVEAIDAKVEWNAIRPATTTPYLPDKGVSDLYFQGIDLNLRAGDGLLLFAHPVDATPADATAWQFRIIETATLDTDRKVTHVTLDSALAIDKAFDPEAYVMRRKAAVFGHNAPSWKAMPDSFKDAYDPEPIFDASGPLGPILGIPWAGHPPDWPEFVISPSEGCVDLDTTYPQIAPGSWLVLSANNKLGLFKVAGTSELSRAEFAIAAKITRVVINGPDLAGFVNLVRQTTVYAVSDKLAFAEKPVEVPVFGTSVSLSRRVEGLVPGQALAFAGRRARIRADVYDELEGDDNKNNEVRPGDFLDVLEPPLEAITEYEWQTIEPQELSAAGHARWHVRNRDGVLGVVFNEYDEWTLVPALPDADVISEVIFIDDAVDAVSTFNGRTVLKLKSALVNCYDPDSLAINANVAHATHGESVSQILGGGSAAAVHQRFDLKQLPLTFVGASNESGAESTLTVRVDDIAWTETPTLFGAGKDDRSYVLRIEDDARAVVQFGDGRHGSRLPSGIENVTATYRKGIGADGNVLTGRLLQLLTRPLGLKSVTNPEPALGGTDPDGVDSGRGNMPLSVRTLGRTVSLRDYEDFARAFTGIAKAQAVVLNLRAGRTVLVTVAGEGGKQLEASNPTLVRLLDALRKSGDPSVRFELKTYTPVAFRLSLRIKEDPGHLHVKEDVEAALGAAFSFDARQFGQAVTLSQVIAVAQGVPGVIGADLDSLYTGSSPKLEQRLIPERPHASSSSVGVAAELLIADPAGIEVLGGLQ